MKIWLIIGVIAGWIFLVEMLDIHLKLRKFQRKLGIGTPVKYPQGVKWRFGEVKSVHGEIVHVAVDGGLEWVKRGSLWPIERWDRANRNVGKS